MDPTQAMKRKMEKNKRTQRNSSCRDAVKAGGKSGHLVKSSGTNGEKDSFPDQIISVSDNEINTDAADLPAGQEVQSDRYAQLHYISGGSQVKKQLEYLKSQGIVPKMGKWSSKEVQQLHENMLRFLSCHKIKNFRRLILPQTKDDLLFRKENNFVLSMCQGIQRTRRNIHNRIEAQYSNFLKRGTLSVKERERLFKLQKIFGNKWQKIGYLMGRYHRCMSTNYRYAVGNWNKGPWSEDEDKLLIAAVAPYLERNETISWSQVTRIVGTRSQCSCGNRWIRQLSKQIHRTGADVPFSDADVHRLIDHIHDLSVVDEYLINWDDVASQFNDKYKPGWLRCKFSALVKEVPSSHLLEFSDLVEQLRDIYQLKKTNCVETANKEADGIRKNSTSNGEDSCTITIVDDDDEDDVILIN